MPVMAQHETNLFGVIRVTQAVLPIIRQKSGIIANISSALGSNHISRYSDKPNPEKALIQDILFYLNQFPLTFGWYSTGVAVYDDTGLNRIRERDSDFFILHQRCIFHHLPSPIEIKKTYAQFADSNKKHIDLNKVFSKPIIQNGVFEGRYR